MIEDHYKCFSNIDDAGSYKIIIFFLVVLGFLIDEVVEVNLIPQETTQAREALQELGAFRRFVSHEFDFTPVVLVVNREPLGKR